MPPLDTVRHVPYTVVYLVRPRLEDLALTERVRAVRGDRSNEVFARDLRGAGKGPSRSQVSLWTNGKALVSRKNAELLAAEAQRQGWPEATPDLFHQPELPVEQRLEGRLAQVEVATEAHRDVLEDHMAALEALTGRVERLEQQTGDAAPRHANGP